MEHDQSPRRPHTRVRRILANRQRRHTPYRGPEPLPRRDGNSVISKDVAVQNPSFTAPVIDGVRNVRSEDAHLGDFLQTTPRHVAQRIHGS